MRSWFGFSVFFLAACGGGDGAGLPTAPPGTVPVASVTLSPNALDLPPGQNGAVTATLRAQNGAILTGRIVAWTSNAPSVATVSNGVVTGVSVGSATITATSEGKSADAPVTVTSTLATYVSVAAGGAHTCALTAAGAAYCWGRGESGQLGVPVSTTCAIDSANFPCRLTPGAVRTALVFTQLTAGGAHTCGLTSDGTAYCWGSNLVGQLGDNSNTDRNAPVAVLTALKFVSIDAGAQHTCALTSDGTAYCWGRNDRGQLGDATSFNRLVPVAVSGGLKFERIAAGGFNIGHTCALTNNGAAYCWGDNERGQLGIGTVDVLVSHPTPQLVAGGLTFTRLSAGLGRHNCALTAAGIAYCWGENSYGALGDGSSVDRATPIPVSGGLAFAQVSAGGFVGHSCGFDANGAAYCWGDNEVGALGNGTTNDKFTPFPVAGAFTLKSMDSGFRHTCAITTNGILYCWGSNGAGQLGVSSTVAQSVPSRVVGQP